jgi:pyrroloquinoline quinone (PQQ) biosynthesis protein C
MNLFKRLADVQKRWNVLRHPFYTRWERGELTVDELAFYAGEYRHAVVALARQAEAAGAEHAAEEARHVDLWDDFAGALDADLGREPRPETLDCFEAWTGGDDRLERLAVMYAVESVQPAISQTKLAGLAEHYGFEADGPAARYFVLHAERDVEHAEENRRALAAEATEADVDRLVAAAEAALRGNWRLLDGVEARG